MKHLLGTLLFIFLLAGCQKQGVVRYQRDGGSPEIDFLEVQGDTLSRFYGPGNILLECPCRREPQGVLSIQVTPLITARLRIIDDRTLEGEAPFFEGVWVRQ